MSNEDDFAGQVLTLLIFPRPFQGQVFFRRVIGFECIGFIIPRSPRLTLSAAYGNINRQAAPSKGDPTLPEIGP